MIVITAFKIGIVVAAAITVSSSPGRASESAYYGPNASFERAKAVFAGRATHMYAELRGLKTADRRRTEVWSFEVEAVWKGVAVGETVDVRLSRGEAPRLGELFLVYAEEFRQELVTGLRTEPYFTALVDRYKLPEPFSVSADFEYERPTLDLIIDLVIDSPMNTDIIQGFRFLREESGEVVPLFVSVIRSRHFGDPLVAIQVLTSMGSAAEAAIPDLQWVAEHGDPSLRKDPRVALTVIKIRVREEQWLRSN